MSIRGFAPNRHLDELETVRVMGAEGLANVEEVRDPRDGLSYTLKWAAEDDPDRSELLVREFRILQAFRHARVPRVVELARAPGSGRLCLLLEYRDGVGLAEALPELTAAGRRRVLLQALRVLDALHGRGLLHGDLKPEHLLINTRIEGGAAELALIDFGLARDETVTEEVGGTPAFLPPRQLAGALPSSRSDLYALGRSFLAAYGEAGLAPDPELAEVVRRLAEPDEDLRYATAEAAFYDLTGAEAPRPTSWLEPAFQGAEDWMVPLERRLQELHAGRLGSTLLALRGPSGSGKTRRLEEFATRCKVEGCRVLRLTCGRGARPGSLALDALVRLNPERGAEGSEWSPTQRNLRDAALELRDRSLEHPLAVLVDDLHLASELDRDFLRMAARLAVGSGPVFAVALATVEGDLHTDSPFEDSGSETEVVSLPLLRPSEVQALLDSLHRLPRLTPEVGESIVKASEGNPRRARELATAADPERAGSGSWRELLRTRLGELGVLARGILEDLADLGGACPVGLLEDLAEPEVPVRLLCEELCASGFVRAESREAGRWYSLDGRDLSELLEETRTVAAKRTSCRKAYEAWNRWPRPEDRPAEGMIRLALDGGLLDAALALGRTRSLEHLGWGSYRVAADILGQLLDEDGLSEIDRADLESLLAETLVRSGQHERASQLLRGSTATEGPGEARLRVLLGWAADGMGDLAEAQEHFSRAQELGDAGLARGLRLRLVERLGTLHHRRGRVAEARELWEGGVRLAGEEADEAVAGDLLNDLGIFHAGQGEPQEAIQYYERALGVRRALGDLDGEARTLSNLGNLALQRGEFSSAAELYEESLRLKRQTGSHASQSLTLRSLGLLHSLRGEAGLALSYFEESLQLRRRSGDRRGEARTRTSVALLHAEKGSFRRARTELEAVQRLGDEGRLELGEARWFLAASARVDLLAGGLEEAEAALDAALARAPVDQARRERAGLLRSMAQVAVAEGQVARAEQLLEEALAAAFDGGDRLEEARVRLELARLLHDHEVHSGEGPDHLEHFRRALELATATGAARLETDCLFERARFEARAADDMVYELLLAAEQRAADHGAFESQLRVWSLLGSLALERGLNDRCLQWWSRGLARLLAIGEEFDSEPERDRFFALPLPRELLHRTEEVLGRTPEIHESLSGRMEQAASLAEERGREPSEVLGPSIFRRLLDVSRRMNGLRRREELFEFLRRQLGDLFGAENSQIVLVGRDGSYHLFGEHEGSSPPGISHTLIDRAIETGRPLLIRDTKDVPNLRDKTSVRRLGLVAVLAAPLKVGEKTLAVVQFDHRSRPSPFTEADLLVLELLCQQAATALHSAIQFEDLQTSLERQRASEAQLVASQRMRALGEMSAGIAHDFNNLLMVILGITDLLRAEGLPADLERDLEILEAAAQSGVTTVARLQEFAGHSRSSPVHPVNVSPLVRGAVEMAQRRVGGGVEHGIELDLMETPPVICQGTELSMVVLNLLMNGLEAMPKGGSLRVRTLDRDGMVIIEVEDAGPGIPEAHRSRIFEPFFTTKTQGKGLGLSICWGIARRIGGSIDVRPAAGGGAVFAVILPAAPAAGAESAASLPAAEFPNAVGQGARVVVVDDDPTVLGILCRMLDFAGYRTVRASDAEEALVRLEESETNLLLTDYLLPGMNGCQLAREARKLFPDCRIVLLTGLASEAQLAEEGDAVDTIIQKPISRRRLEAAIRGDDPLPSTLSGAGPNP